MPTVVRPPTALPQMAGSVIAAPTPQSAGGNLPGLAGISGSLSKLSTAIDSMERGEEGIQELSRYGAPDLAEREIPEQGADRGRSMWSAASGGMGMMPDSTLGDRALLSPAGTQRPPAEVPGSSSLGDTIGGIIKVAAALFE
jgi:hypothetical protein